MINACIPIIKDAERWLNMLHTLLLVIPSYPAVVFSTTILQCYNMHVMLLSYISLSCSLVQSMQYHCEFHYKISTMTKQTERAHKRHSLHEMINT